jgi:hypothetical protein
MDSLIPAGIREGGPDRLESRTQGGVALNAGALRRWPGRAVENPVGRHQGQKQVRIMGIPRIGVTLHEGQSFFAGHV